MMYKTTPDLPVSSASPAFGHRAPISESLRPTQNSNGPLRELATDPRIIVLHGTLISLVRRDGRDLTARQLAALLSVYMDERTHTVSSLAELLHISRPGVTRIMDRLVQFDLVAREEDREDRRRVLARRTTHGAAFFAELVGISRSVNVLMEGETA